MNRIVLLFFLLISCLGVAQHQDKVDFIRATASIYPIPSEKQINGTVTYEFNILQNVDSIFIDAKNMNFTSVLLNNKKKKFSNDNKVIIVKNNFRKGKNYRITLQYKSKPAQTVYFLGWEAEVDKTVTSSAVENLEAANAQIWTQGQGKYTSHWLPCFDDMTEKVEFDLAITFNAEYEIVANGKLVRSGLRFIQKNEKLWVFDMQKPMSSYLLAFVIGNYDKQELTSTSGIPIENYFYPLDSLKVEPTYRYTKEIFDFLEREIGLPYPWQNYKQVPVKDFLYAGMENTSTTIFSDQYVIDSIAFVDKNYVNVNAHEMAHQWFGNLVTEKDGNHHWLHEGFATYYAYLAEKEIFGDDHFYWEFYNSLQKLKEVEDRGEGQSLLEPKASSLTFYEKGAWALFMLRNEIGDKAFKKGIKGYLQKFEFKNATVNEFLKEMEAASGKNLSSFREEWLVNTQLPMEKAKMNLLRHSPSIKLLFDIENELQAAQSDDIDYLKYWDATNSIHLKKYMLKNYNKSMLFDGIKKAFESDTIPIRQALLEVAPIDDFLPKEYLMDFLDEKSYVTQEMALFQLWQGYPEDRVLYLNKTKEVVGLPNMNVRLMWLTLAILTEGYDARNTKIYFDELSGYTGPEYAFEVRQGAFFYLKEAFGLTEQNLMDLAQASTHHTWQFKKFARNLIDELLKDEVYKDRLTSLMNKLKPEEKRYIQSKLN